MYSYTLNRTGKLISEQKKLGLKIFFNRVSFSSIKCSHTYSLLVLEVFLYFYKLFSVTRVNGIIQRIKKGRDSNMVNGKRDREILKIDMIMPQVSNENNS